MAEAVPSEAVAASSATKDRPQRGLSAKWLRFVSPFVILILWQIGSSSGLISRHTLAAPSQVIASFQELLASGELQQHLLVSLGRVAKGVTLALLIGSTLGLMSGLSRLGEYAIDAPLQMLRTLPVLGLIPLFILWFGIGELPKVALITVAATFPIYLTLYSGIRGVEVKLVELARIVGLSRAALIWHVILPGALPVALVGLRYALGLSWLVLVPAEQVNATSGIGYLINDARDSMRTDRIVVGLIVYALLGLAVDILVRWLERRFLSWRPSFVSAAT